jgi:hypothetical protein
MIWPRAFAKLFPLYKRQHSREQVDVEKPDGAWGLGSPGAMMQKCAQEIQPVDCYGPAGTVRTCRTVSLLTVYTLLQHVAVLPYFSDRVHCCSVYFGIIEACMARV